MFEVIADPYLHTVRIAIPVLAPTSKARPKQRSDSLDYGKPFSRKHDGAFRSDTYIEWQVSYYDEIKTCGQKTCVCYKSLDSDTCRVFAELSEVLRYFVEWRIVSKSDLSNLLSIVRSLRSDQLLDQHQSCLSDLVTLPNCENINGISFQKKILRLPQLVYEFDNSKCVAEIGIRDKQRAIGVQPMLYLCVPITELEAQSGRPNLVGRTTQVSKEAADLVFDQSKTPLVLKLMEIFGMLSENHRADVSEILEALVSRAP